MGLRDFHFGALRFAALGMSVAGLLICGCSNPMRSGPSESVAAALRGLHGMVHGGQQPVTGASIQLYAVGTGGDGSTATPLLSPAAATDANGNFNITGTYTCPSTSSLIYVAATGGNPGLSASNPNLSLMAALGPCGNLTASTFIFINELTTVGAVYALAPFIASPSAIGSATSDATALASAFTLASELVNTTTGTSPGTNVPTGVTIPVAQIDTLGNILAACVNSAGGTAGDGSNCGSLFSLTTPSTSPATTSATNTITALLNLANNPTLNTAALYSMAAAVAPFQPAQTVTPPDFTVRLLAPPTLYVFPSLLSFGPWGPGFTSPAQTITITNYSSTAVSLNATISGVNASSFGFVSASNSCGTWLAPQASCSYQVDFAPTVVGALNAYLVLANNSANPVIEIPMNGTSVAATAGPVMLSQSTLSYTVGDTTQDVMIENFGTTPLTIFGISTPPTGSAYNFSETTNCPTVLAAQSACSVSVVSYPLSFLNSMPQTVTGTLTIDDNASTGPQSVSLTSTDSQYFSNVTSVNFTSVALGSSKTAGLTFTNGAYYYFGPSFQATIGGTNAGDFSVSPSGCVDQQLFASSCPLTITFTPTASGTRKAQLLVDGTNQYIPLTGTPPATPVSGPSFTATSSIALLTYLPASPDPNSATNASSSVTITNNGSSTFSFSGILSGPYALLITVNGSNCLSLAPQQSCSVPVSFSGATSAGVYPATLTVRDTNSTASQVIPITATAQYWQVTASPSSFLFGEQGLGTTSAAKTFVLADSNGYPLGHPLSVVLQASSNFTLTQGSTCPASITQTCTLAVAFSPHQTGSIGEVATLTDQISGYTYSMPLNGTGGAPVVSLTTNSITFPTRSSGTTSVPMTVTVTNTGTQPLIVSGVRVAGAVNGNFTETNNCTTVAMNGTCSINVTFAPTSTGMQSASVQIVSNGASSPDSISVSGTAQ